MNQRYQNSNGHAADIIEISSKDVRTLQKNRYKDSNSLLSSLSRAVSAVSDVARHLVVLGADGLGTGSLQLLTQFLQVQTEGEPYAMSWTPRSAPRSGPRCGPGAARQRPPHTPGYPRPGQRAPPNTGRAQYSGDVPTTGQGTAIQQHPPPETSEAYDMSSGNQ